MTSQGRACPVNVGVSPPKCPNKVGTARTHTHKHTQAHDVVAYCSCCQTTTMHTNFKFLLTGLEQNSS